jgi:hypothetical protein
MIPSCAMGNVHHAGHFAALETAEPAPGHLED